HNSHVLIRESDPHLFFRPAEHRKCTFCILSQIKATKFFSSFPRLILQLDMEHFVYAEVLHLSCVHIISDEIIVFVVPGQSPWAHMIWAAVLFEPDLFRYGPLKIFKQDLLI